MKISQDKGEELLKRLLLIIFLLFVLLNLISFWVSDNPQLVCSFADDAFFYFKIAANVIEKGQFTFDGQNSTNGFQPLWMILLLPFFLVTSDSILALRMIGSFSAVLLGVAGYLSLRYIGSRYSLLSYAIGAAFILKFVVELSRYNMETSLLIPLCVVSLIMIDKTKPWFFSRTNTTRLIVLGITLSLLQLTRLDAVFFNFAILGVIIIMNCGLNNHKDLFKTLILIGSPSFITGSAYLFVNYAVFGHFIPVSGLVKTMGGHFLNSRMIKQLTKIHSIGDLTHIWSIYLVMFLLTICFVVFLLLKRKIKNWHINLDGNSYLSVIVSVFFLVFTCFHLLRTSWRLWGWYSYPGLLVSIFVIPAIFQIIKQRLEQVKRVRIPLRIMSMLTIVLLLCWMSVASVRWGYWGNRWLNFKYQNYLMAEALNKEFKEPVRFAMGDMAGSFAYFFNGDVLQLEGVVGDYKLLQSIKQNTLMDYMSSFGVDYVMSYVGPNTACVGPPQDYSKWTLLTPLPLLSAGPRAEVDLCKKTEIYRRKIVESTIIIWKWPSCDL